jgi:hypothetical protein
MNFPSTRSAGNLGETGALANRDYAAAFAAPFQKLILGTSLLWYNPPKMTFLKPDPLIGAMVAQIWA